MTDQQTQAGYKCPDCDHVWAPSESPEFEPLYECGACGVVFIRRNSYDRYNRRCPECMKLASKASDMGCPECGEGEVQKAQVVYDEENGEWVGAGPKAAAHKLDLVEPLELVIKPRSVMDADDEPDGAYFALQAELEEPVKPNKRMPYDG